MTDFAIDFNTDNNKASRFGSIEKHCLRFVTQTLPGIANCNALATLPISPVQTLKMNCKMNAKVFSFSST